VLCLGAVIRGETTHDQHINTAVANGIESVGRQYGIPVLFGLLTCDTLGQAEARAGGDVGNKGAECAEAAIAMINLLQDVSGQ
jgi:6,7-dimethyl-8-ribityllumazine synthase